MKQVSYIGPEVAIKFQLPKEKNKKMPKFSKVQCGNMPKFSKVLCGDMPKFSKKQI